MARPSIGMQASRWLTMSCSTTTSQASNGASSAVTALVAARALAATTQDLTWQASAAGTLAAVNLVRGRLATAEVQIRQAMTFDEQRGVPGKYLDDAIGIAVMNVHYRNAPDAAQREVEAALRRHPLASIPAQDRPYLGLAWLYADAGRPERARQLIAE